MQNIRIIHANILQGFIFDGGSYPAKTVQEYNPGKYTEILKPFVPDIVSLHEVLIDDQNGTSKQVENIKNQLNLKHYATSKSEKSWFRPDKHYGSALLINGVTIHQETIKLPKPKENIEAIGPDGSIWVLHEKSALAIDTRILSRSVKIISLHYFPFHHFGRRLDEKDFEDIRKELVSILDPGDTPTIVVGDFNNKGIVLAKAFPELFDNNHFVEAIKVKTSIKGGKDQLDHILYTPDSIELIHAERIDIPSDHYGLLADFRFR
ncbi:endonuclease/exonuclease/phosphatase family protein [Candidatus Dojkabacteria bacterium]|nr:endonuclease/exonuclease/phosphatase family protein [Candidatus Dojkabacteria bacterium]